MITRREFSKATLTAVAVAPLPLNVLRAQENVMRMHGSTLLDSLKYPEGFTKFDYANPNAPKGGAVTLGGIGGFDSFNPFIVKGDSVNTQGFIFESLTSGTLDEGASGYGLLAEWIEHPEDYSWVAYRIRDDARWHDGEPVTAADVVFSLETLIEKGAPFYRFYYANVTGANDEGDNVVRFEFDQAGNHELPHIVGDLSVLPKHWWETRDFEESSLEPPLGSGPYRIGSFEANRFVEFERVEDYWGQDFPARVGHNNFDHVRIEYYQDATAAFEAFKAGDIDFRSENQAKRWATAYDFPAVKSGHVIVHQFEAEGPKTVQGFSFNLRRTRFADIRVRKALDLLFDFEWTNRTIFFDQYARPASYFQGISDLMAVGEPQGLELEILESVRADIPEEAFGPPVTPNQTDGSGRIRPEMRLASDLFAEAGWTTKDNQLVNADGEQFKIEFITGQEAQLRIVGPFFENLKRLGIDATSRVIDWPQYINRVTEQDFDMVVWGWSNSESPGNEQREFWGSETATRQGSRNVSGVQDPAVDALIERIVFAKGRAELAAATRALDRVLTHNYYALLELYAPLDRIAYWDRFGHPDPLPPRSDGFPTLWWWDAEKAAKIAEERG